jgi:hypothetical protein
MAWVRLASLPVSGFHTPRPRLVGVTGGAVVIIVSVQGVGVGEVRPPDGGLCSEGCEVAAFRHRERELSVCCPMAMPH